MTTAASSYGLSRPNTTSTARDHVGTASHAASPTKHTPQQPPTFLPSDSDLLLRSLRLLDLDLLPDWPGVKCSTFRGGTEAYATQKDRIRAAEWVLYRLFERWNPRETKAKLGALFPALEPLQSIKLRAALLQWLTELKGQGVLGKECMIRKSMLDECKGEKFEEVLLHLSTAVLRKVVRERNSKKGGASAAQRLCLSNGWSATEEGAVNVLPYAHEASIQRSLQERKARRQKLSTLNANLSARTTSMQREHDHLDLELRQQHWSLQTANVDAQSMKTRMRQHSPGHAHWLNLAMSGDLEHGRDAMIEDQFKKVWSNAMAVEDQAPYDPIPSSVLADLERRVKLQQGRLARWRGFQEELSRRNEDLIVAQSPAKTPFKSPLKKFGSPQKTTPRRAASTRKPERAASVENTSTRLQSLQVSPTKSLSNSAKPNEAEARDATGPLQPPLDLRPLPAPSDSADDPEALCADMADLQLSSVAPGSPTRRPLTHPHQQRTLLPSPSKSPGEQSTTTLHASSVHAAMQTTPPDNVSTTGSGNNINGAQLGYEHEAAETKPQCAVSTPPTPVETLTERTARTMAEWQQKAMIVQATGTASHSRTGSSATANPHRHKHTRSIPVASITSGSPERVVGDTAIQMKARPHRFDGSADCAGSLGSPSQCGADSAEQRSSELGCTSSAVYTDPRSGDHDGLVLASKTSAQSGQQELDEPAVDDESPFKPRNRLRRTPPTSPSPWAAAESNQDYH